MKVYLCECKSSDAVSDLFLKNPDRVKSGLVRRSPYFSKKCRQTKTLETSWVGENEILKKLLLLLMPKKVFSLVSKS